MKPRLRVEIGTQRGQVFEIPPQQEKESILLGRGAFCDVRINDMQVSTKHCQFINEGSHLYVEDLGSKNGTRVNAQPIKGKVELEDGDTVNVGTCALIVEGVAASRGLRRTVRWPGAKSAAEQLAERILNLEGKEFAGVRVQQKTRQSDSAVLYRGIDSESGQPCALKILRPDADVEMERRNRMLRGAKYASQFHHPHMIRLLRGGKHDEVC